MRKKALQVTLDVHEPSVVELTVADKVQLDRLTRSSHGFVAERHRALLEPGVATLALDPGLYFFKTLRDANLRVVRGGVNTGVSTNSKDDPFPDQTGAQSNPPPAPDPRGDEIDGEMPSLTVE
jgi:hypothetical protein